ncbi:MAG: PAS domain S-box protein [Candidatus Thermoplasmatota archaeon]
MLLVDDEPALLELAKFFLERNEDITAAAASSAKEATEMMRTERYDAVVCDYQMPGMDGLEFLKALRAQKDDIPFVLFTGKGREDVAIEALNSGADFYLQKGGDPNSQFAELANMIRASVAALRSERELARSEERFRLLAENSKDLVFRYELLPEPRFEYVSPSATRIVGYTPEEHYANPRLGMDLVHPDDRHHLQALLEGTRDPATPLVVRWMTKDGRLIWTEQRLVPIRDPAGRTVAIEGTAIDVTERVNAEEELRRSEAEYRRLVMTVPSLICRLATDGRTLFVNEHLKEVTGYAPEELVGRNWWDVLFPGNLRGQVDSLMQDLGSRDVWGREMTLLDKAGSTKTLLWSSFNERSGDGRELQELNFAAIDVTARKAAENALRESGAFNRAVLDSLDANIAVLDGVGRIVAVNKSWLVFAGVNDADLSKVGVGCDYLAVCEVAAADGDESARRVADAVREVLMGIRSTFSMEYPCDSPERKRWFMLDVTPLPRRRGGAVVSHMDITPRKTMEEALKASEAHYRSIFEATGTAMAIIAEDDTLVLVNSEFEKLSGRSKAELEGKVRWRSLLDPKDLAAVLEYDRSRFEDPASVPKAFQLTARDRFGAQRSVLANAAVVPGTRRTIISVLDETERRRYEDAAHQASKKLDLLARITRHDILNQLAVLFGYLELARERSKDEQMLPLLAKAAAASESIRRHLEFARDYQNMGTKRPQWVDIQATCRRVASNVELKGVRLVAELGGVEVFADPMLEKVFYNLLDNTMKHGKRATIASFGYSAGADGMRLVYQDDGVGVPGADKASIFERSEGDIEGRRGYGLYLAREILSITGITISETGREGEGARFEMFVPRGRYRTKREPDKRRGRGKARRTAH